MGKLPAGWETTPKGWASCQGVKGAGQSSGAWKSWSAWRMRLAGGLGEETGLPQGAAKLWKGDTEQLAPVPHTPLSPRATLRGSLLLPFR